MIFVLPGITSVKTKGEAITLAQDWQKEAGQQSMNYLESSMFQDYFERLAKKFNLTEEFKENGII